MKNIREETNERTRHARTHICAYGGVTVLIFCRPRFATRIRAVTATTLLLRSFRMRVRERETVRQRERGGNSSTKKWVLGVYVVSSVVETRRTARSFMSFQLRLVEIVETSSELSWPDYLHD